MYRRIAAAVALVTLVSVGSAAAQAPTANKPAPPATPTAQAPAQAPAQPKPVAVAAKHEWTTAEITEAQTALKKAGFFSATVDGKMNEATRHAIRRFEKAHALPVNGMLSEELMTKLRAVK